jgi:4-aminobutyrate aminotransferase-like enzyme
MVRQVTHTGFATGIEINIDGNMAASGKLAHEIKREAFNRRLIIQTAGIFGNYIKIAPSFFVSDKTLKTGTGILNEACEVIQNKWINGIYA